MPFILNRFGLLDFRRIVIGSILIVDTNQQCSWRVRGQYSGSLASRGEGGAVLRQKLDAIGYGFFIPIFFIVAGMKFDISALWANPLVPVQVICLLGLLTLIRDVPIPLYNQVLAERIRGGGSSNRVSTPPSTTIKD